MWRQWVLGWLFYYSTVVTWTPGICDLELYFFGHFTSYTFFSGVCYSFKEIIAHHLKEKGVMDASTFLEGLR
jgi:hypothetical protein